MIRVLVAEDSTTTRELLVEVLSADPEVRVVAQASNGLEAVALAKQLLPSVITMDIEMPRMGGFDATRRIMIESPTPIVIVSRNPDLRGVEVAMHALRAGALTVLPTPPGPGSPDFEERARSFVEMVKAMSQVKVVRRWGRREISELPPTPSSRVVPRCRLVAIAASTGGPAAVSKILSDLQGGFPVPILVVQHIASGFVEGFASWLNTTASLPVKLAVDGERLCAGTVYVAPDAMHMGVTEGSLIQLSATEPLDGCRPSATFMFDSVARAFGAAALGVILTGMGRDGVAGLRALRAAGARILAQDEESCVVFGMPGAAAAEGLPDVILPLGEVADWIRRNVATDPEN